METDLKNADYEKRIDELEKRISELTDRRVVQSMVSPQTIKERHLEDSIIESLLPAIGTANQILSIVAGVPTWTTPTTYGDMSYANSRFKCANWEPNQTITGDVAVTGVGFQPKAIIFFSQPNATNMTTYSSLGFSTSASLNYSLIIKANANMLTGYCIFTGDGATWDLQAVIKTFDSDGFTLTWTKTGSPPSGTMNIAYLAFR